MTGGGERGGEEATRTLVVHCPDWPVVAAGVPAHEPAMVVWANRVVAASPVARRAGVDTGLRRREAQRRCPSVAVIAHDPARDARAFEAVAGALDAIAPRIEVTRPGVAAFATRGPTRYHGGEERLAARTAEVAAAAVASVGQVGPGPGRGPSVCVGVADGAFAARLAALGAQARVAHPAAAGSDPRPPTWVVPPGTSPAFLAPHPVEALAEVVDDDELIDVWRRLGLRTLGQVASLPATDVLARFATPGVVAHRLAAGLDPWPLDARRPAVQLAVGRELDPPVDRVDRAAFVAKAMADDLHARLAGDGLACTHVVVEAETEHGETLARHWRHEGALTAGALADRVRWQLDGWLSGSATIRPTAGIVRLTLVPEEVVAARGRQLGFWGGETQVDERIVRAVARLQGTLGLEGVMVPEVRGGRGPADRVVRVPAATVDLTEPRATTRLDSVAAPWPGRLPAPAPATVAAAPESVEVVDAAGAPVSVSGRSEVSAPPARLTIGRGPAVAVTAWAGPWPIDERWWDPERHRRRARFQVVDEEGTAHLLAVEAGRWWHEATYD